MFFPVISSKKNSRLHHSTIFIQCRCENVVVLCGCVFAREKWMDFRSFFEISVFTIDKFSTETS